jgi:thiol-disulfide isomerase/thioredoxin
MRTVRTLVALLLAMLAPALPAATPGEVQVGQSLREAALRGLNGPSLQLSVFRGRPLLINVWASWCGPCRAEMASLERLAWRDPSRGYSMIGISTDDYFEQAAGWLQQTHSTLSHFIDNKLELENMLGASRLPLTVLVDAKGRVLQKVYGARDWDSPESIALIDRAFRKAANAP